MPGRGSGLQRHRRGAGSPTKIFYLSQNTQDDVDDEDHKDNDDDNGQHDCAPTSFHPCCHLPPPIAPLFLSLAFTLSLSPLFLLLLLPPLLLPLLLLFLLPPLFLALAKQKVKVKVRVLGPAREKRPQRAGKEVRPLQIDEVALVAQEPSKGDS